MVYRTFFREPASLSRDVLCSCSFSLALSLPLTKKNLKDLKFEFFLDLICAGFCIVYTLSLSLSLQKLDLGSFFGEIQLVHMGAKLIFLDCILSDFQTRFSLKNESEVVASLVTLGLVGGIQKIVSLSVVDFHKGHVRRELRLCRSISKCLK